MGEEDLKFPVQSKKLLDQKKFKLSLIIKFILSLLATGYMLYGSAFQSIETNSQKEDKRIMSSKKFLCRYDMEGQLPYTSYVFQFSVYPRVCI